MVDERKAKFARALFANRKDAFLAAGLVTKDYVERFEIAAEWPADADVIAEMVRLEEEQNANQPSRNDFLDLMWMKLEQEEDGKAFASMAKVYAEVRGFAKSAAAERPTHAVMVVNNFGNADEWSGRARNAQKILTTSHEDPVEARH